jgi:GT2 family glycosyltransferase
VADRSREPYPIGGAARPLRLPSIASVEAARILDGAWEDPARPDVSVLILSWNTRALTLECLDSLPRSVNDDLTYEVIMVDNGSRDGSAETLAERDDIELIRNPENRGYAAAVNQAYARARGEFVLLLNSDVEFEPGSLSTLLRFLREHEDVAGVGPLYLNPDRTPQQHHFRLPTFWMTLANTSRFLGRIPAVARQVRRYRMLDDDFSRPLAVPQPSASCLLLRHSALPERELMDERYPIYFNDVALAHWLATRGETLWVTPDAVVLHEHGASTRQLGGQLARQHIAAHVRYLGATQPRRRLLAFMVLVLAQKLAVIALRRPGVLPLREVIGALRGDPGPLPQAPSSREV